MMSGEKDWVYGVKYKGRLLSAGEEIPLGASLTLMVGNGTEDILEDDSLESDVTEPVASESSSTQDDSWF